MPTATITTRVAEVTDADERHARAAWSIITEPGDAYAGAVIQQLGHIGALTALEGDLAAFDDIAPGAAEQAKSWLPRLSTDAITRALRTAEQESIRLVDPATVPGIADLDTRAPHLLWVRGDINALGTEQRIALTGARASTGYGETVCADITRHVIDAGVTVHGGGAYGIDGAMHRAALSTGGSTVAWLAGASIGCTPPGMRTWPSRSPTRPVLHSSPRSLPARHPPSGASSLGTECLLQRRRRPSSWKPDGALARSTWPVTRAAWAASSGPSPGT